MITSEFPATGMVLVSTHGSEDRGLPVPCVDIAPEGRPMRIYPVTTAERDVHGRIVTSTSRWERLLIEDVDGLGELPLYCGSYAAAVQVAKDLAHQVAAYVQAQEAGRQPRGVNPLDPVVISAWVVHVGRKLPDVHPMRERLTGVHASTPPSA